MSTKVLQATCGKHSLKLDNQAEQHLEAQTKATIITVYELITTYQCHSKINKPVSTEAADRNACMWLQYTQNQTQIRSQSSKRQVTALSWQLTSFQYFSFLSTVMRRTTAIKYWGKLLVFARCNLQVEELQVQVCSCILFNLPVYLFLNQEGATMQQKQFCTGCVI